VNFLGLSKGETRQEDDEPPHAAPPGLFCRSRRGAVVSQAWGRALTRRSFPVLDDAGGFETVIGFSANDENHSKGHAAANFASRWFLWEDIVIPLGVYCFY
jgi:hypothetical protein